MILLLAAYALVAAPSAKDSTSEKGFSVCKDGERTVLRLEELPTFESPTVDLHRFGMPLKTRIADETLFLERDDKVFRYYRIDRLVSSLSDLDIDAKLGVFENRPVLVWQETYMHRPSRFGVMTIDGEELSLKCEGLTGSPLIE